MLELKHRKKVIAYVSRTSSCSEGHSEVTAPICADDVTLEDPGNLLHHRAQTTMHPRLNAYAWYNSLRTPPQTGCTPPRTGCTPPRTGCTSKMRVPLRRRWANAMTRWPTPIASERLPVSTPNFRRPSRRGLLDSRSIGRGGTPTNEASTPNSSGSKNACPGSWAFGS